MRGYLNEVIVASLNQKTAQSMLLQLENTKDDVKWKKIGRYRIFLMECQAEEE